MVFSTTRLPCISSGKCRLEMISLPPTGRVRTWPGRGALVDSIAG